MKRGNKGKKNNKNEKYDGHLINADTIDAIDVPSRNTLLAEECKRSFFKFITEFWSVIIPDKPVFNWHIPYLSGELTKMVVNVVQGNPKPYDLLINIPPGTTKSLLTTTFFPAWAWTNWPHLKFIKVSYSSTLSLEHAENCRELIRSPKYQELFPDLKIKRDKDQKSNFRITYYRDGIWHFGGSLFSSSIGATLTGFHWHILLVDDPIDPQKAHSEAEVNGANNYLQSVLPTRCVEKGVVPTIMIMQRVAENDPSGERIELAKQGAKLKHICLPGEIHNEQDKKRVSPPQLVKFYKDGLLDPIRLSQFALNDLELRLGKYGYAGQIQQDPSAVGGGMFDITKFVIKDVPLKHFDEVVVKKVRYWDKAGTQDDGAYTVGVLMYELFDETYVVADVVRGQWSTQKRESMILAHAEADGNTVMQILEQEPGSGGKESAENSKAMLRKAGLPVKTDRPTGDKIYRADPWSVRINKGQVVLIKGDWNGDYIREHRLFPRSKYKDQVDGSSGAYGHLFTGKRAGTW